MRAHTALRHHLGQTSRLLPPAAASELALQGSCGLAFGLADRPLSARIYWGRAALLGLLLLRLLLLVAGRLNTCSLVPTSSDSQPCCVPLLLTWLLLARIAGRLLASCCCQHGPATSLHAASRCCTAGSMRISALSAPPHHAASRCCTARRPRGSALSAPPHWRRKVRQVIRRWRQRQQGRLWLPRSCRRLWLPRSCCQQRLGTLRSGTPLGCPLLMASHRGCCVRPCRACAAARASTQRPLQHSAPSRVRKKEAEQQVLPSHPRMSAPSRVCPFPAAKQLTCCCRENVRRFLLTGGSPSCAASRRGGPSACCPHASSCGACGCCCCPRRCGDAGCLTCPGCSGCSTRSSGCGAACAPPAAAAAAAAAVSDGGGCACCRWSCMAAAAPTPGCGSAAAAQPLDPGTLSSVTAAAVSTSGSCTEAGSWPRLASGSCERSW